MEPHADEVSVRLYLTAEEHKKFRVVAAAHGVGMAVLARQLVVEFIQHDFEQRSKRCKAVNA